MSGQKNNAELESLLSALGGSLSDEELLLSMLQADIAAVIAAKRVSSGLSQKELAAELNVSQSLVSKWESGETNFTLETLVRLALKLNIKMKSPFVSDRPVVYCGSGKIVSFPHRWFTGTSGNDKWTQLSNRAQNYELEEM